MLVQEHIAIVLLLREFQMGASKRSGYAIPFLGLWKAKGYAESFSHNMPRIIRVNPKNPQETRFFEQDQ